MGSAGVTAWQRHSVVVKGLDVSSVAAAQPLQIEKMLGADCSDVHLKNPDEGGLYFGMCKGAVPEHVVRLFMSIPAKQIHMSPQRRLEFLAKGNWFKAIPGRGQRADFFVRIDQLGWIRTLEGPDPKVTTYLVNGPFRCPKKPEGTDAIGDVGCVDVSEALRVFVVKNDTKPVDATQRLLSNRLQLSKAESKRLLSYRIEHPDDALDLTWVNLDTSRLGMVPVLRRYKGMVSDDPAAGSDPRAFNGGARLHFGFEEWNGKRFVRKTHVSRAAWPCEVDAGRECDNHQADPKDRFVTPLP